ncbi:MAG: hypothetical protein JO261_15430, partial [Alphaproteobacteria bacterium]|nr:hypothetical protein [Alphaproteobacteria bacterium]
MKRASIIAATALTFALQAQAALAATVTDVSAEWAGYWNAKNLKAILTLYAPEPIFCPTNGKSWSGIAEIRKNFAGLLAVYDPRI